MAITTYEQFKSSYLLKNGNVGDANNINKAADKLKQELEEVNGKLEGKNFVVKGSIANGKVITLNTDGTVSEVYSTGSGADAVSTSVSNPSTGNFARFKIINSNTIIICGIIGGATTRPRDGAGVTANQGFVYAGTISGNTITLGTRRTFGELNSSTNTQINDIFPTTNGFLIEYLYYTSYLDAQAIKYIAGTVSGNTITLGSAVTIETTPVGTYPDSFYYYNWNKTHALSQSSFVFAYSLNHSLSESNTGYNKIVALTVSGNTISKGSIIIVSSINASSARIFSDKIDSTRIFISYNTISAGTHYFWSAIASISGTTITIGTPITENTTVYSYYPMTSDTGLSFSSTGSTVRLFSLSGTTITPLTSYINTMSSLPNESGTYNFTKISDTLGLITYSTVNNRAGVLCSITGSSIVIGTPALLSSFRSYSSKEYIYGDKIVMFFEDDRTPNDHVYAKIIEVSGNTLKPGIETLIISDNDSGLFSLEVYDYNNNILANQPNKLYCMYHVNNHVQIKGFHFEPIYSNIDGNIIGVATNSANDGQTLPISILGYTNKSLTGLESGKEYYTDIDGDLTTTNTGYKKVGIAVSPTELLIECNGEK